MPPCCLLCFLVLCYFPIVLAHPPTECPLFYHCKNIGPIHFPLTDKNSSGCGLQIRGCNDSYGKAEVQLGNHRWYRIESAPYGNSIVVQVEELEQQLSSKSCTVFDKDYNISLPTSPFSLKPDIMIIYKCNRTLKVKPPDNFHNHTCPDSEFDIYYGNPDEDYWQDSLSSCSKIQLPIQHPHDPTLFQDPNYDLFEVLTSRLFIEVETPEECLHCYETNDICLYNDGTFSCGKVMHMKNR
ncbi:hypothetical protein L6164_001702 [Bauhinia variegata]|uniref:Uncharacterized protein n=1 Tax=Bauhinia variegata TaxID=167791 RepID=A0ACB9Q9U5_BAUVA|nr:hypothetical protein L6164_001702 [Bauhinia variegata]